MELEALRTDLITLVNHYGKTIPIGTIFYILKDVTREVGDAYEQWMESKRAAEQAAPAEKPEPAEKVEGEVEE